MTPMSVETAETEFLPEVLEEVSEPVEVAGAAEESAEHAAPEESAALALSVDEFAALEERVLRAVNLVKRERMARTAAEEYSKQVEAQLADHTEKLNAHAAQLTEHLSHVEQLQSEVKTLRSERDHVRQRVERLLSQLDALEI